MLLTRSEFRERFVNHRLATGTGNGVEGCYASEVTNLPLVGNPLDTRPFSPGQVHQQLREV
jgi:hypothetical protein